MINRLPALIFALALSALPAAAETLNHTGCSSTYGYHQGTLSNEPPLSTDTAEGRNPVNYLSTGMALWACPFNASMDHTYRLDMQGDGNLVLYWVMSQMEMDNSVPAATNPNVPVWATGTQGTGANLLMMWPSGNLTLYAPGWAQKWTAPLNSGVNNPIAGSKLWLSNTGKLWVHLEDFEQDPITLEWTDIGANNWQGH